MMSVIIQRKQTILLFRRLLLWIQITLYQFLSKLLQPRDKQENLVLLIFGFTLLAALSAKNILSNIK